jgi:protein-tyrosine kinase
MAKVFEALQRAEQERKRKAGGEPAAAPAVVAEPTAHARRGQPGFLRRLLNRSRPGVDEANEINKRRISLVQPSSFVAEQFRTLRGRLDSLASQQPLRTIAVCSALPGDGKTTAAINLAIVTAMSVGRRILLVDCDLRKPKIHRALGLRPTAGLGEVLLEEASLDEAVCKVEGTNLEVLPVRGLPGNPSELLASTRMRSLVGELAQTYDRVILDTPATLGLPDAKTVSELCDGLVLVVRAGVTPRDDIQATLDTLDRRRVLGAVLNGAHTDPGYYGY